MLFIVVYPLFSPLQLSVRMLSALRSADCTRCLLAASTHLQNARVKCSTFPRVSTICSTRDKRMDLGFPAAFPRERRHLFLNLLNEIQMKC